MLSVLGIWLYMAVTTFLLGYGMLQGITHFCPYRIQKWDSYFWCGLAGATVYAQFFSLFASVGLGANLLLIGICLGIILICKKNLAKTLADGWHDLQSKKKSQKVLCFMTIGGALLLYAYGTSRGYMHYDTALYHAQSIRWIEEYGAVAGLGNLHCRLAYNSASFALSALYSMIFLGGRSYHCAAGFLALLLFIKSLKIAELFQRKRYPQRKLMTSDFARIAAIYYLLIIFDEMVSPASDYFMVLTAFYLVISWLELEEEKNVFPYAMLCVLGIFLMTIKLSAALIVLLVVKPAWELLQKKKWKEIGIYTGLGILSAAPYLIRNVILSGWLVYPFTFLDFFDVDWKIPKGIAQYDAKEIQVWGRGYHEVTRFDIPLTKWLPEWFAKLGSMDKLFVLAALAAVCVFILRFVWYAVRKVRGQIIFQNNNGRLRAVPYESRLLLEAVLVICFLFWLFTSPLIRYGCVYVYLVSAVVFGDVCTELFTQKAERILTAFLGVFLLYKVCAFGAELTNAYENKYWIYQKDYDNFDTISYEIEGSDISFYYPAAGDQTGYDSFPSSPTKANITLRGKDLKEGFRAVP